MIKIEIFSKIDNKECGNTETASEQTEYTKTVNVSVITENCG